ncbi:hypothetical protein ACJJTC_015043, partial [Scirpophaga incertulas]
FVLLLLVNHAQHPKQPCPESICVRRNVRTTCRRANHCGRIVRITSTVRMPADGFSSLKPHLLIAFACCTYLSAPISRGSDRWPRSIASSRQKNTLARISASRSQETEPASSHTAS